MTMNKDMRGATYSDGLVRALDNLSNAFARFGAGIAKAAKENRHALFEATKPIISVSGTNYWDWAHKMPSRFGSEFPDRVDFWAQSGRMDGVLFLTKNGHIVFPLFRTDNTMHCVMFNYVSGERKVVQEHITNIMPLFPKAMFQAMNREQAAAFTGTQKLVAYAAVVRDKWLKEHRTSLTKAEREAISELDAAKTAWDIPSPRRMSRKEREERDHEKARDLADAIIARQLSERGTVTGRWQDKKLVYTTDNETFVKGTQQIQLEKEGKEKMNFKESFVGTQKSALAQVSALQAGRASNKVIKEAMRPLVSSFFKPNFMQRVAMKLFGIKNPTDKFMQSDTSDMVCAQLAQLIVEVRGVENENVRKVTEAGIVYAGNKLADNIPLEETIDSVVAKLVEGADSVAGKLR